MIFIVPDIKSNFDAAAKAGDHSGQSDILTDQLAKIIHDDKAEVIALLKESGIDAGYTIQSIAQGLADGLSRDANLRTKIATLIIASDERVSGTDNKYFTKIKELANDPAKQDSIKNIANGFIGILGQGKKEESVKEIVEKVDSRKDVAPKKSYKGLYITLGILATGAVLTFIFVKINKSKPVLGLGTPTIAATGAEIPVTGATAAPITPVTPISTPPPIVTVPQIPIV